MSYTMEDFKRDFVKEHFPELPVEDQKQILTRALKDIPLETRLADVSLDELRAYLEQQSKARPKKPAATRRKKKS